MAIGTLFLVPLVIVARVYAQSTNIIECIPEYQWSINHRNQTPCLVAAYLESACSGRPHQVNGIPPDTHYIGPISSDADACQCNTVTYSLVQACGGCQNRSQFISFTQWANNCPQEAIVPVGQFPRAFPDAVEVLSWAELNISQTNNTFNPAAAAREAARNDLPPITSSSTSSSETASLTQSQTTPFSSPSAPASNEASDPGSGGLSSGAIAGITIGVLVVVVGILLFIFWRMLRARRRRNSMQMQGLGVAQNPFNEKANQLAFPPGHAHSRSLSDPASITTPYIYNTSDINPRPDSAGASTHYTTGPIRNSMDDIITPQSAMSPRTIMTVQGSNPPRPTGPSGYTGAPEV